MSRIKVPGRVADVRQGTAPQGRRERNKAEKRARILAAAQNQLDEVGYEAMSMAQVARDADVAMGTVFQYAATKPELLMMVTAERWAGPLAELGRSEPGQRPVDDVLRALEPLVRVARQEPHNTMVVARELLFGAPGPHRAEVVALVAGLEERVAAVLLRAGAGPRADAAARLVVSGGLLELNRTRTGRAGADSVERRLREMVELVVAGALG